MELVLAQPVGRHAPLAAALVVVTIANAAIALAVAATMASFGPPVAGSIALGTSIGGVGLVAGAIAAVTAQLADHRPGGVGSRRRRRRCGVRHSGGRRRQARLGAVADLAVAARVGRGDAPVRRRPVVAVGDAARDGGVARLRRGHALRAPATSRPG